MDIANNKVGDFPPMFINSCYNDMMKGDTFKFAEFLDQRMIPYVLDFPKADECTHKMGHVYSVLYPEDWEESRKTIDNMCEFFRQRID